MHCSLTNGKMVRNWFAVVLTKNPYPFKNTRSRNGVTQLQAEGKGKAKGMAK